MCPSTACNCACRSPRTIATAARAQIFNCWAHRIRGPARRQGPALKKSSFCNKLRDLLYLSRLKYRAFFSRRAQPLDLHPRVQMVSVVFLLLPRLTGLQMNPQTQHMWLPGLPNLNGRMIWYPLTEVGACLTQNDPIGPINRHRSTPDNYNSHCTLQEEKNMADWITHHFARKSGMGTPLCCVQIS